jgi:hypothetical protein
MNKNKLTTAGATLTPASYVSPTAMVKEIHSEGVLCMSINMLMQQDFGHETWVPDDNLWS